MRSAWAAEHGGPKRVGGQRRRAVLALRRQGAQPGQGERPEPTRPRTRFRPPCKATAAGVSSGWPTSAATMPGARVAIVRRRRSARARPRRSVASQSTLPVSQTLVDPDLLDRGVVEVLLQRTEPATASNTWWAARRRSTSFGRRRSGCGRRTPRSPRRPGGGRRPGSATGSRPRRRTSSRTSSSTTANAFTGSPDHRTFWLDGCMSVAAGAGTWAGSCSEWLRAADRANLVAFRGYAADLNHQLVGLCVPLPAHPSDPCEWAEPALLVSMHGSAVQGARCALDPTPAARVGGAGRTRTDGPGL